MSTKMDSTKRREAFITDVCQQVAELPDRNSPEDWPEAMLVTYAELELILAEALDASSPEGLASTQEPAYGYARRLAESLHAKHFPEVTQWRPLDDTLGVLTQIDNMTCGLKLPQPEPGVAALREALRAGLRNTVALLESAGMDDDYESMLRRDKRVIEEALAASPSTLPPGVDKGAQP